MTAKNVQNRIFSWDGIKDILTILVIPALLWVSNVSTTLEVTRLKNESLSQDVTKLEHLIDEQMKRAQDTSERLVRLETRIDSIGQRVNEIRDILVGFNRPDNHNGNPRR